MQKVKLLELPTKIEKIRVDNKNSYYIKRDDLSGFYLGGNKARKIEYFMYDILEKKSDVVVTYGSSQSNHCRIVAGACAKFGLKCILIISGDTSKFNFHGNDLLYKFLNAEIVFTKIDNVKNTINETINKLKNQGYSPYFIQGGGHGNWGTLAYIETYNEIKNQSSHLNLNFDYIFLASGTGTTQAGLEVGKYLSNGKENIVGISIAREKEYGKEVIMNSIMEYLEPVNLKNDFIEINFIDDYRNGGYGINNLEIIELIKRNLIINDIILDPIYTGKAFWGMMDYIDKNGITNKNILFLHTGGLPIFFGHNWDFKI